MLQGIACAIDARSLAIPDCEHAIDLLVRIGFHLLRAENSGCGQILINSRQKLDVVLVEK